jgi:hypothetical protein
VDLTVNLVGHPNFTAVGPEAWRHYSWSFNLPATGRKYVREGKDRETTGPVNPVDAALLARYDHVVTKYARSSMVERNPVVVDCGAPPERRKQRDDAVMDLVDVRAFCGENVARGERGNGIRGLRWSNSQVFFQAGTIPRQRREQRGIPVAVDPIDILGAEFAHEQKIRRSGHARGKGGRPWNGKGSWIGGVKHSCER